jgi:ATP adenylyltransferase/5',5'''-P-1,P-4-tetraphosphate phosphorylase II
MNETHLKFNTSIGVKKPNSIREKEQSCPFCEREKLTDILAVEDNIILLKNKFPVLENTLQTVLIETDDCSGDISTYSIEHLEKLLAFGLKHWLEMENSGRFKSVLFFKNHGPLSGGTIAHPHMQIVGLHEVDYTENAREEEFEGLAIDQKGKTLFTISTAPKIGFYEFNVRFGGMDEIGAFAAYIQTAVRYILDGFPFKCSSYNLFFYKLGDDIFAKAVPRFVTTPIYIGYSIPQVPNNLEWMREDIRSKYFGSFSAAD